VSRRARRRGMRVGMRWRLMSGAVGGGGSKEWGWPLRFFWGGLWEERC
jgi:hypothetical protein